MSASKYRGAGALAYNGDGMMRLSLRKHGKQKDVNKSLKIALVCSDCLLVSFQPLLVHLSKSADGTFAFDPISVNLLVECVKCVFAVCFIVYTANQPSPEAKALRSVSRLRRAARENLPLAFPSALHAVNNYLKFAMQLYFSPTTVRMLANLKVLMIAVLLKTITRRRFSVIQWEALALLVLGVTVNQMKLSLGAGAGKTVATLGAPPGPVGVALASPPPYSRWHMADQEDAAMSPMFISFPSFASVFNEVTMKKNFETSVSLQMFFSYFWGAVFNLIGLFGVGVYRSWNGGSEGWMPSVFRGHSVVTCLLVANNAAQGILSTFFFKFADSVMKKHSSNAATIFTALLSAAMFGHTLRANFVVGGAIVLISMHMFYAKPDALLAGKGEGVGSRKGGLTVSPSMEHFGGVPSRTQSSSSFDSSGSAEGLGTVEEGFGSPTPLGVARSRSGFGGDRESLLPR
jgi:hypothetical protein